MIIKQLVWDVIDSNSWLLLEKNSGLLFDVIYSDDLDKEIVGLDNLTIVLTHCHFDHIVGLNKIRNINKNTTVVCTQLCSECIGNPKKNTSFYANNLLEYYNTGKNIEINPFSCESSDVVFTNDFCFTWQNHKVNLKAVHGHSADSLISTVDNNLVFTGDTLLSIPTITRLPGGNTRRFWNEDIPLLKSLDGSMTVYPGHGYRGKLEDMIAVNKRPERLGI